MQRLVDLIANHLLVCLTLCFITGIAVSPLFSPPPAVIRQLGEGLLLFLLPAGLISRKSKEVAYCLLLPLLAGIGFYSTQLHLQPPSSPSHLFHRIEHSTEAVIVGTLSSMPTFDGTSSQLSIAADFMRQEDEQDLRPATGTVLLRLAGPFPDYLTPGALLAVRANVKRPESGRSPGAFDYARYLAEKDIWVTGFIRSAAYLQRLEQQHSWLRSLRYCPENLRLAIGKRIDATVSGPARGVFRAILIGDYSRVDDATMEAFKSSGTMHILSVSGLHMSVIGSFLYLVAYWLLSRSEWLLLRYPVRKIAAFLSLPILVFYSFLAGLNTPVLRSVIMSGLVIVALCTDRRKSPSTLLAFAALVILALDPLQLFSPSFQLSFVAVLAILFLYPALEKMILPSVSPAPTLRRRFLNWLVAGTVVSVVATLATAPLTIYFFNRFSTIGVIANLIAEPIICMWSLPAGFLAIPLLSVAPGLCDLCLNLATVGLEAAIRVIRFFAALPGATLWLPSPALWQLVLFLVALLGVAFFVARNSSSIGKGIAALFGLFLCLIIAPWLPKAKPEGLQAYFLDVGQGSASLLQYPSGANILIDGGAAAYGSPGAPSVGERTIAPFLWHQGIRKLNAIVITHPDADHYNGLEFIIRHFSPSLLWVRDPVGHDRSFRKLIERANDQKIPVVVPGAGDRFGDEESYVECLENMATAHFPGSGENRQDANSGLVLKACGGGLCMLFPGDIEMADEKKLITHRLDLTSEILLAAHHGSRTSNSPEFLTAVGPRTVAVSAGRAGGGHFPHNNLIHECQARNISLLTTAQWGTLSILARHGSYQIWGYERPDANPLRPFQPILLRDEKIKKPGE